MPTIAIQDEIQWLALRKHYVGASEVGALFDVSPFQTRFQLWHTKAGNVASSFIESEEMFWGKRQEQSIGEGIAERHGLLIEKCTEYFTHPTIRGMGATPDFIIHNYEDAPAILEIKNIGSLAWDRKWVNDAGDIEPPLEYELQVQAHLACTRYEHAWLGVLVGGQKSHLIEVKRHDAAIKLIENAVATFWESIAAGDEPEPFNASDYVTALALFEKKRIPSKDFTGHAQLPTLCADFLEAKERHTTAKTQIINILRGAEASICAPYTLKFSNHRLTIKERTQP